MTVRMQDGLGSYGVGSDMLLRSLDTFSWRQNIGTIFTNAGPNSIGNTVNIQGAAYPGATWGLFSSPLAETDYLGVRCFIPPTTSLTIYIGDSVASEEQFHYLLDTTTGTISAYRGATLLGSSSPNVVPTNAWFMFVGGFTIGSSEAVTAYIEGIQKMSLTGVNTQTSGNAQWDTLGFTRALSSAPIITDIYVATTNLGSQRILTGFATANGATDDFTSSTSNPNYENVNSYPQTAHYNSDATPGDIDLFAMAAASGSVTSVRMIAMMGSSDAGVRSAATYCKSGSASATGASRSLGVGPVIYSDLIPDDPNTSSAWTLSNLNAAQFGYTVVA